MPDNPQITGVSIFVGILIGGVMSVACLLFAIFIGSAMQARNWLFPAMNGVLLLVSGIVAFRSYRESGIARGVVIVLALAFALNGVCGVALLSK